MIWEWISFYFKCVGVVTLVGSCKVASFASCYMIYELHGTTTFIWEELQETGSKVFRPIIPDSDFQLNLRHQCTISDILK